MLPILLRPKFNQLISIKILTKLLKMGGGGVAEFKLNVQHLLQMIIDY
jgi:hypothetical protein